MWEICEIWRGHHVVLVARLEQRRDRGEQHVGALEIDAPVAQHAYWGTGAVIEDLRKEGGWAEGYVVLKAPLRAA